MAQKLDNIGSSTDDKDMTLKLGNVHLSLRKGLLQQEKADVIVTNSAGNLNLKAGRTTQALLEAAGEIIQEQCQENYPYGISLGDVAETDGGNLNCQYVFYCFMTSWKDEEKDSSRGIFSNCVKTCLNKADAHGVSSMVFPALGTGLLRFPVDEILKLVILCIIEFCESKPLSTLTDIAMIVHPNDDKILQGLSEKMKKLQKKPSGDAETRSDFEQRSEKIQIGKTSVTMVTGSIVEQKADVLVNLTNSRLRLNTGMLSRAFLNAAGDDLQVECDTFAGGLNCGDIAVTEGYSLPCKMVYHTTLPNYTTREKDSHLKVLTLVIQQCLMQLEDEKFQSIAFPCFGSGQHGYPDDLAAATFLQTVDCYCQDNRSTCIRDISLVIYPGGLDKWREVWQTFVKELNDLKRRHAQDSDAEMKTKPVYVLPNQGARPKVMVRFDPQQKKGTVDSPQIPATPARGTKEWFKMKYTEDICTPKYWLHHKGGTHVKKLKLSLEVSMKKSYVLKEVDRHTRNAVVRLVTETWEKDKVGAGKDARGLDELSYSKIEVKDVLRVENLDLYEKYAIERQRIFSKAWKKGGCLTSVQDSQGSGGQVHTYTKMNSCLKNELFPEINEHYLFHGTKENIIEKVLSQGLDNRMAGDNAMFGAGVYAAESSTKADQYTDYKDRRTSSPKKMFLVKMCLGEVHVSNTASKYRRPPCKKCVKDDCAHKHFYDSVVGDGKWIFREFVLYDPRQSYPEFMITYVRK
ncbi:protein mono-ADP-ribosyltransferase PARP14-like [Ylistrum balloti]|uniref:protein mono-ADP-ribosyltransferase PARP14-like n=1 Tax=Ylistrum balloti TaxID=509963 RepID=UPI00290591F1|nr:protein mono-ADP-ribosyltransferase PARP14-like [Ylistrum balloti]